MPLCTEQSENSHFKKTKMGYIVDYDSCTFVQASASKLKKLLVNCYQTLNREVALTNENSAIDDACDAAKIFYFETIEEAVAYYSDGNGNAVYFFTAMIEERFKRQFKSIFAHSNIDYTACTRGRAKNLVVEHEEEIAAFIAKQLIKVKDVCEIELNLAYFIHKLLYTKPARFKIEYLDGSTKNTRRIEYEDLRPALESYHISPFHFIIDDDVRKAEAISEAYTIYKLPYYFAYLNTAERGRRRKERGFVADDYVFEGSKEDIETEIIASSVAIQNMRFNSKLYRVKNWKQFTTVARLTCNKEKIKLYVVVGVEY
jgi:hypothetical protein